MDPRVALLYSPTPCGPLFVLGNVTLPGSALYLLRHLDEQRSPPSRIAWMTRWLKLSRLAEKSRAPPSVGSNAAKFHGGVRGDQEGKDEVRERVHGG